MEKTIHQWDFVAMTVAVTWLAYAHKIHKGLLIIPSYLRAIPICNLYLVYLSPFNLANLANAKALRIAPGRLPISKVYIAVVRLIWRSFSSQANSSFSSLNRRLPVLRQVVGPREDGQKGQE